MTPQERSDAAKARWAALSDEQKAERLAKMRAGRTPNPDAAPKVVKPKMTAEERSQAAKDRWIALSDEEKTERIAKMVAGRALTRAAA